MNSVELCLNQALAWDTLSPNSPPGLSKTQIKILSPNRLNVRAGSILTSASGARLQVELQREFTWS